MDINVVAEYLKDFASKSESVYHVNPWIFGILFFGSAIPLYYGYYRIGKSVVKFEKRKLSRKEVIDKKELKVGLAISVIAWWLPYLYVIIFGHLSIELWIGFILFVAIMGLFFIRTLKSKIHSAKSTEDDIR